MTYPHRGNIRRSFKDRVCDCGCGEAVPKGSIYFATEDGDGIGPHFGWWYYRVECARRLGHMAPSAVER